MARRNAPRSIGNESNLARRVERERRARGWSYDTLAKKMTDVGCPLSASALFKIEKSDPPRKISVDELVAMAMVFDTKIDDLLTPVEMLDDLRSSELARELDETDRILAETVEHITRIEREVFALGDADLDELKHEGTNVLQYTATPTFTDAQGNDVTPTKEFVAAWLNFRVAITMQAVAIHAREQYGQNFTREDAEGGN